MTTTVRDYDLSETSKLVRDVPVCPVETYTPLVSRQIKGVYTSLAMMAFLHIYFKYTQPLFVQGIMAFKSLYEAKTVKIHVFGQNADGDLKRPFKSGAGLFGGACSYLRNTAGPIISLLTFPPASADPQTDKAAIEEAEKRIGAKKEE